MEITIVAVGRIREKYISSGMEEYKKDLDRYCRLNVEEVPDEKAPDDLSPLQLEEGKDREGQAILRRIKPEDHVIALDIRGKQMSSRKMADYIGALSRSGVRNIVFVIGGSNGLSRQVLDRANLRLSFSDMTFPHQLMRLILLEQVGRWIKPVRSS